MTLPTVLYVEDNRDDETLLQLACQRAGTQFKLVCLHESDQAIAFLQGTPPYQDRQRYPTPALVLMDLRMPKRTGLDLIRLLQQDERLRHVQVILLTSSAHEDSVREAYGSGAACFLEKPAGFDEFLALAHAVNRAVQHQPPALHYLQELAIYVGNPAE